MPLQGNIRDFSTTQLLNLVNLSRRTGMLTIFEAIPTGEKDAIYDLALSGFFASVGEDEVAPGGFLHTQYFVLVDKNGHIRGLFDGTVYSEMKKDLTDALDILYREDSVPLKGKSTDKIGQRK